MSIKEKYKMNVTFDLNINLLNIKKQIEFILTNFDKIQEINNKIGELDRYYEEQLEKIKNDIKNIKIATKFIKREELFTDIIQEDFIKSLEFKFNNIYLDYFSPEISNFYLYIYLLKNELYDENSYMSSNGINDDYIWI